MQCIANVVPVGGKPNISNNFAFERLAAIKLFTKSRTDLGQTSAIRTTLSQILPFN